MERKTIETKVGLYLEIDTDYDAKPFCIDKLQEFLSTAKENGATNIKIKGEIHYDYISCIDIEPIKMEIESDEVYAERMAEAKSREIAANNVKKAKEKALYEELKAKYG